MKVRRFLLTSLILILAGALVFGVAACGDEETPTTETTQAATSTTAASTQTTAGGTETTAAAEGPVAVDEWVIPQISVTTGAVAFAGEPAVWGAQRAVAEINAAGGIRGVPVRLVEYDTGFDAAKAVSAVTEAVAEALVILGPMDGPGAEACAPICFENKVPAISAVSNMEIRASSAPFTCCYMLDGLDHKAVLAWVEQNPDIKTYVGFGDPSDPAAWGDYQEAKVALEAVGVTCLKDVEVKSGQLDMATPAVQAIAEKPDGFICILRQDEMAKLGIELKNRGVTEGRRIYITFAALGSGLLNLAQGSLEGAYGYNKFDPNYESEAYKAFSEAFSADHDGQPLVINTPVMHYNAVYAIKSVMEQLQITGDPAKLAEERQAIAEALNDSQEFEGIQGPFKWVDGQLFSNAFLQQIVNDAITTVGEISVE